MTNDIKKTVGDIIFDWPLTIFISKEEHNTLLQFLKEYEEKNEDLLAGGVIKEFRGLIISVTDMEYPFWFELEFKPIKVRTIYGEWTVCVDNSDLNLDI